MMERPVLTIVVPCYNEEEVLPETVQRLSDLLAKLVSGGKVAAGSNMLLVDDGSRDRTWELIKAFNQENPYVSGLKLSRNKGHQHALFAGLMAAKEQADCVVSIDADLQDDVDAIAEFVDKFRQGYDIVYGVRRKRETDTLFKRWTALGFYKLMKAMGVNIVYNHADFRLMSRMALEDLAEFTEVNLFLRGIVPLIGYKSTEVYYDRSERFAGESKYPLKKMLSFALDGITSFSITPIRMVTALGFVFSLLAIFAAVYALGSKIAGATVPGWTSLLLSVWFIGGIQLMCIGLIGEYIGKVYMESKRRPKYFIEEHLRSGNQHDG